MRVGHNYEVVLKSGRVIRGVVRSVSLPPGTFLKSDGRRRIWLGGEGFEYFIRPDLVAEIREVELASS